MKKYVSDIKKVLLGQLQGYQNLFSLLTRERESLVDFDEQAVEQLSKEKDTLILKLRLLEDERIRLVKRLTSEICLRPPELQITGASDDKTMPADFNLAKLAELTGDNEFMEIRASLKSLLQSLEELNSFNRVLIDRSLSYVQNNLNLLNSLGSAQSKKDKIGMFLTREA
ncbi:flagellar protein FlgN [Candidatus Magnetomonas plexicatena]|uniref:flagellar protein FlgN n=1 Tax=Candidatus Magnetomonas plexicatena TaxID=2552947 RepID=UPI001100B2BC|nr:flagellar protein FlgN [Nitrospirales bacterium LBB_01]